MGKLTLELGFAAGIKPGVVGQRGASHWRCLFLPKPAHPPRPFGSIGVYDGDLYTELLHGVCGVLILGTEHPVGMANSRLSTCPLSCVGVPGTDMADFRTPTHSRAVADSSEVLRIAAAGEARGKQLP